MDVTGITAEKAAEIEDASVTTGYVNEVGNLVLVTHGGEEINAGAVTGSLYAWPIGSVYIRNDATNPADILGGGTWARFGQGKFLVSQNDAETEFDTALETGGSKTITEAMLPPHRHKVPDHTHAFETDSDGAHTHDATEPNPTGPTTPTDGATVVSDDTFSPHTTTSAGAHTHTGTTEIQVGDDDTGDGDGVNDVHLPPYIVVYMWVRTA